MIRKRTLIGIGAAVGVAVLFFAAQGFRVSSLESAKLAVPHDNPFWYAYDTKYGSSAATVFVGDFVVSGTYFYGRETENGSPIVFVVPDAASTAALPYLKRWGPPKRIDLTNPDEFATAALQRDVIEKVAKKRLLSVRGRIAIKAHGYEVTGECDQPIYLATFKSVVQPRGTVVIRESTVTNCG